MREEAKQAFIKAEKDKSKLEDQVRAMKDKIEASEGESASHL